MGGLGGSSGCPCIREPVPTPGAAGPAAPLCSLRIKAIRGSLGCFWIQGPTSTLHSFEPPATPTLRTAYAALPSTSLQGKEMQRLVGSFWLEEPTWTPRTDAAKAPFGWLRGGSIQKSSGCFWMEAPTSRPGMAFTELLWKSRRRETTRRLFDCCGTRVLLIFPSNSRHLITSLGPGCLKNRYLVDHMAKKAVGRRPGPF